MRVLLVDVDSRIPNLALMKISAYHKAKGDEVGFNVVDPDIIYSSIMFTQNKHKRPPEAFADNVKLFIGGPGYDPKIKLSPEIEQCPPDHSIYPNERYSVGRVTSGCIRKCYFCVVPQLEPDGIRFIQPPEQIWKPGTELRLLDDNILVMKEAFDMVYKFSINNNVVVRFEYLDIRLLTPYYAQRLREMHLGEHKLWFSYDMKGIEKEIKTGIKYLLDAGHSRFLISFFIYCHDTKALKDAKDRYGFIKSLGCVPFLMVNEDHLTPELIRIRRKANNFIASRKLTLDQIFDPVHPLNYYTESFKKEGDLNVQNKNNGR